MNVGAGERRVEALEGPSVHGVHEGSDGHSRGGGVAQGQGVPALARRKVSTHTSNPRILRERISEGET